MKILRILLIICLCLIFTVKGGKQLNATDLNSMKRLSSGVLSPDKNYIVYAVRIWDRETGKVSSYLEYINLSTKVTKALTDPKSGLTDYNPLFNPLFPNIVTYLTTKSNSVQAWYVLFQPQKPDELPTPVQLTSYPLDIDNLKFTSNSLVFSTEVFFDCLNDVLQCTATKNLEVNSRGPNTWAVYTKMFVRHWDRWTTEGKGSHLFLHTVKQETIDNITVPKVDGLPIDMMSNLEANSPVPPFGGGEMFDVRSDGLEIAFTSHNRSVDESWVTGWKTYIMNTSTMKAPQLVTSGITARTQNPRYSPDKTKLAYLAMNRPGLESDNLHIEIYDTITGKITKVTDFFDASVIDYMWYDANTIIFTCTIIDRNKLYMIDTNNPNENTLTLLIDDEYGYNTPQVLDYSNGSLFVQRSSWTKPDELATFTLDLKNKKVTNLVTLIQLNDSVLKEFDLKDCESFEFTGGYNDKVGGLLLKPKDFDKDKKYPLAFLIHGGPEGGWGSDWSYRWNPQLWAHRGYAVVMINPHGSSGRGIKFQDAVRDDWGGVPYQDLMTGLDYVLENYKWIDSNRTCACGASYGGYMINWIQGQTDRFNCLVTHDGVFSTLSMFYATEELWFPYAEYCPREKIGCNPFDPQFRDRYLKFSPEAYVQNWKTPHLVIHGSRDFRIPISEGLSVFSALQVKGIKSKFLHMTQENHWVIKAENSIKWYDEVLGWMDEFTKEKETFEFLPRFE